MPLAIRGTVYELDGYTPVAEGTFFSVHDTVSGYYVQGTTGLGQNSGGYATIVHGNNGDTLNITVSNGYNIDSITVTLNGVMKNVNLLLDTSLPPLPPIRVLSASWGCSLRNPT